MGIRRQPRFFCPVDVTLSVINGKWKPLILFHLKRGPRRFGALLAALPEVSHKVLTQHLRELERDGLVRRQAGESKGSTYALTEFGETLKPSLTALAAWGRKHHRDIGAQLEWA